MQYLRYRCNFTRATCSCFANVTATKRIFSSQKILPKVSSENPDFSVNINQVTDLKNPKLSSSYDKTPDMQFKGLEHNELQNIFNRKEIWREIKVDYTKLGQHCLKLSKFRLTSLVVTTSTVGYGLSCAPFDPVTFFCCTLGTGLVSSAANSINQFLEVPFDAQMSRTRSRVLVQGHLMPIHAVGFAVLTSVGGLLILYFGTNPLTAVLGATNLALYTMIYTPLKRISILNTWVGSVVGSIPPLMGWAACQGSLDCSSLIVGGILYAWQFPHFNALSWNLRPDYSKAGYRMMAVTDPALCRRTALQYTIGIIALSSLAPVLDLTHWSFAFLSMPLNLYFTLLAYRFYKESDSKTSRQLFRFSLLHLPVLLTMMFALKKHWAFLSSANEVKMEGNSNLIYKENMEERKVVLPQLVPSHQ